MKILIISPGYPNKYLPEYEFVKQLVDEWARQGHSCYVIAPFSVVHHKQFIKKIETIHYLGGGSVTIHRPNIITLSNITIGNFKPSSWFVKKGINRALKEMNFVPDIIYGHFWSSAYRAYHFAHKNNIPLFVASGESEIRKMFNPENVDKEFFLYIKGVICVSTKNKDESIELGLTTTDKCVVIPNAISPDRFFSINRHAIRKKLGFPDDAFIVVFTGWFINRKGPERVAQAIAQIRSGEPIYSIFIGGKGEQNPECDNILFKGVLPHEEIYKYLNAADVFVLPTLKEGCCNAIIEAMACGLPIISSDLQFNKDILNNSNSILINPLDISAISRAIVQLRDNRELRERLAVGAKQSAMDLTIEKRGKRIAEYLLSNSR